MIYKLKIIWWSICFNLRKHRLSKKEKEAMDSDTYLDLLNNQNNLP